MESAKPIDRGPEPGESATTRGQKFLSQVVISTLLLAAPVASAQGGSIFGSSESESMEELIVTSPPSLRSMAAEVTRAQLNIFSVFNELNQEPDFDIMCRKERPPKLAAEPIVNYAPVMVCRTRFMRREIVRENEIFIEDGLEPGLPGADFAGHSRELNQKMSELTRAHPELREAMSKWSTLNAAYHEARAEEEKNSFFARLFNKDD